MQRNEILKKAKSKINGDRHKDYGEAYENHNNIARLWSVILQKEITPEQVYQCMIAVKMSRLINSPKHLDSWVDIVGYAALAGEDNEWNEDDGEG